MISLLILSLFWSLTFGLKPSPGCNKPFQPHETIYQKVFINTLEDDALGPVVREYIVQFPPRYDNTVPLPLVLDVHGWKWSAYLQRYDTAWGKLG